MTTFNLCNVFHLPLTPSWAFLHRRTMHRWKLIKMRVGNGRKKKSSAEMKRRRKRMKIFHRQPGEYPFRLTCFRLVGFQFESRCFFLLSLSPRARCTAAHTSIGELLSHWRSYDFCYCSMLFPNPLYTRPSALSLFRFESSVNSWTHTKARERPLTVLVRRRKKYFSCSKSFDV